MINPPDPLLQKAAALYREGRLEKAIALGLEQVNDGQSSKADWLILLGACYGRRGDNQSAIQSLEKALLLRPDDIHALNNLGLAYKHLGDPQRAAGCWSRAIEIAPSFIEAQMHLSELLLATGNAEAARQGCEKVLRFRPNNPAALSALAAIAAAAGDDETAGQYVDRALKTSPRHAAANLQRAALDAAAGRHNDVITRLTLLLKDGRLSPVNASIAYTRLGFAFEKLAQYKQAFDAFHRANVILYRYHATRWSAAGTVYAPQVLEKIAADLKSMPTPPRAAKNITTNDEAANRPVFLVGFPRSGTTLLEQILAAHPGIATVEESDTLQDVYSLLTTAESPLQTMIQLAPADLQALRAAYRRRLETTAGKVGGRLIIDKQPLYTALLPAIGILFPDAQIIFAVRDPRDVIFSCYQQNFAMNEAMYQFLKIESAIEYYDRVISIGRSALQLFALQHHDVYYEMLLDDPPAHIASLLDFLALPWADEVLDFARLSRGRHIDTPSSSQVRKPLHREAVGKFRHYENWLPPAFSAIENWARQWKYE